MHPHPHTHTPPHSHPHPHSPSPSHPLTLTPIRPHFPTLTLTHSPLTLTTPKASGFRANLRTHCGCADAGDRHHGSRVEVCFALKAATNAASATVCVRRQWRRCHQGRANAVASGNARRSWPHSSRHPELPRQMPRQRRRPLVGVGGGMCVCV